MRTRVWFALLTALIIVGVSVLLVRRTSHDPADLSYWAQAAGGRDWLPGAAQGDAEAQFFHGFTLIRTNLVTMVDRIPGLSRAPVIGGLFEKTHYDIDNAASPQQLKEAYQWIKRSADQGFAPARHAEKLLRGKLP